MELIIELYFKYIYFIVRKFKIAYIRLVQLYIKTVYKGRIIIVDIDDFEYITHAMYSFIPKSKFHGHFYFKDRLRIAKEYSRETLNAKLYYIDNLFILRFKNIEDKTLYILSK